MEKRCGDCLYHVTEDGEPYYCAILPLYTFRKTEDLACSGYEPKETKAV